MAKMKTAIQKMSFRFSIRVILLYAKYRYVWVEVSMNSMSIKNLGFHRVYVCWVIGDWVTRLLGYWGAWNGYGYLLVFFALREKIYGFYLTIIFGMWYTKKQHIKRVDALELFMKIVFQGHPNKTCCVTSTCFDKHIAPVGFYSTKTYT